MKTRKRKAVANIQPFGNVSAPRKDVRGNQQFAHIQLSDATAPADRDTYSAALSLAHKFAPGMALPLKPICFAE